MEDAGGFDPLAHRLKGEPGTHPESAQRPATSWSMIRKKWEPVPEQIMLKGKNGGPHMVR